MITHSIIFDHRGRSRVGQEGPLEIRVTIDRKPYYINTGIKVRGSEFFDGAIINRSDAPALNGMLQAIVKRCLDIISRKIERGEVIDVAEVRKQMYSVGTSADGKDTAMLDWIVEQVPMLPIKDGTRRRYFVLINRLKEYGKLTAWSDLTVENLYLFDGWLHNITKAQSNGDRQKGLNPERIGDSAVYNYHRTLRHLISRAVKFGIVDVNPYDKVRGEFRKGVNENTEYLSEDEIMAIESLRPMPGTQMAMARDLFVFQLYTGLSYSDTQAFDISEYKKVDGRWISIGERIKTGVPYVSQLLPQAVEILEKYGMQVPKVNNAQYNMSLKTIQQALGLKTRLHSHLARHTFATRALALGVSIENLARMLGHTNITQTQRYAKVLAESVHSDYDMMAGKLKKK